MHKGALRRHHIRVLLDPLRRPFGRGEGRSIFANGSLLAQALWMGRWAELVGLLEDSWFGVFCFTGGGGALLKARERARKPLLELGAERGGEEAPGE